jgi:hypothetical protein
MNYFYCINQLGVKNESFAVPLEKNNLINIFEEAAKLYFYTKSGFKEAWPLTFTIYTKDLELLAAANIFVLSSLPNFDVIPYYLNSSPQFSNFYL